MTYGLDNMNKAARYVIDNSNSNTFLFFGEMGVGKTTLIKALVKALGSSDIVSSPTYSLVNEYDADGKLIFHFDFYRIKSIEEAYDIGFEDYLSQDAFIIIEWPELIEELWPEQYTAVKLSLGDDHGERQLHLS